MHRALKEFHSEKLPFKRFAPNAAFYFCMLVAFGAFTVHHTAIVIIHGFGEGMAANLYYFSRGVAAPGAGGRLHARAQGPQSSGFYAPMARANCIIHLPEGLQDLPAGTHVEVEWLAWTAIGGNALLR